MENQYKKALAKIVAVFSITTVFLFGFDKPAYASDQADNLVASSGENLVDDDMEDLEAFMNEDAVEEIQEGVDSPYYKEITKEHIESAKYLSGDSSDVFKKMVKAYETQEKLRVALANKKANPYESSDALNNAHAEHKAAYKDHHEVHQKEIAKNLPKIDYLDRKKNRTEDDNKKLNHYKTLALASGTSPKESDANNTRRQLLKSQKAKDAAMLYYNGLSESDPNKLLAKQEYERVQSEHSALGKLYIAQLELDMGRKGASEEKVKSAQKEYKAAVAQNKETKELAKDKRVQLDKLAKEMEDSNGSSQAKKDLADFRDANPGITEADVNSALYKAATLRKQEAEADAAKKKNEKDKSQHAQLDELAKNAVDSNDMTALNKFMAANPDVKEEARESALRKAAVLKKQQEKERKAKKNQNQDSSEKEKDVVPVPKYKEKQNKTKIATDKNGDYIRVDQGSKKSSHKAVVAVQRSAPSKVTNEVVKAAEPAKSSVKANYNTTTTKTTNSSNVKIKEDNNVNRINLLNEALSQ